MPLDHNGKNKGTRCDVCTGCGRCGAETESVGLHVLVTGPTQDVVTPIKSDCGERLVTADIGTTTIALQLYRQDGTVAADHVCVNPQVKYGADVLSRVRAAENAADRAELRRLVEHELEAALQRFSAFLEAGESLSMVLAGNTTMIYLLMGYDPAELGRAPFRASRLEAARLRIDGVPCHVMPGQAAFVGGDITAGIYACGLHETKELTLLIDLGTNGEIVLGNRERMLACATAAGPAFEGGVNRGIWGADMVSILARLRRDGIVDETGLLADPYFDSGVRIADVCVTQQSIRAIQLAKAAIAAGIRVLAEEYARGEKGRARNPIGEISRVVLAGGFGYYLNPADAAEIGLLPGGLADRTVAGGNTALRGALRAGRELLAGRSVFEVMEQGGPWNLEVLNLAAHPDFEKWYIEALDFQD